MLETEKREENNNNKITHAEGLGVADESILQN